MITAMITECRAKHLNVIQQRRICLTASVAPEISERAVCSLHKHHLLWVSVHFHISYPSLCPLDICPQSAHGQISPVAATAPARLQNIYVFSFGVVLYLFILNSWSVPQKNASVSYATITELRSKRFSSANEVAQTGHVLAPADGRRVEWPRGLRFFPLLFCAWISTCHADSVSLFWNLL